MTYFEAFVNTLCLKCCLRRRICIRDKVKRRQRLLDKADHMLSIKLDVVELLKASKLVKILLSASLTPE